MRGHLDAGAAAWPVVFFAATGEVISRPMFTSVDVASGTADASEIAIHARFDEELAAGEFDLTIKPFAKRTIVEVSARVTLRRAVGSIGIAPLSTMFLFSKGSHYGSDDFRAGVHDSDGLWIRSAAARVTWRSLNNPPLTANSYFSQRDPAAFGFVQRDRAFESYQDQHTAYQDRPSLVASPSDGWGDGFVRLVETPSSSDSSANIMATWMPRAPIRTNAQADWRYQLEWSAGLISPLDVAEVHRLAIGIGGVAGVENSDSLRKFVVDFKGPVLEPQNLPAGPLDAYVSVSPGNVQHVSIFAVDEPGTIRLAIDTSIETTDPVELRAYLIAGGRQLTETWVYQWRARSAHRD